MKEKVCECFYAGRTLWRAFGFFYILEMYRSLHFQLTKELSVKTSIFSDCHFFLYTFKVSISVRFGDRPA